MKDSSQFQEIQVSEIEDRLTSELDRKRNIDKKLIVLNEQIRNQKYLENLRRQSNFILT